LLPITLASVCLAFATKHSLFIQSRSLQPIITCLVLPRLAFAIKHSLLIPFLFPILSSNSVCGSEICQQRRRRRGGGKGKPGGEGGGDESRCCRVGSITHFPPVMPIITCLCNNKKIKKITKQKKTLTLLFLCFLTYCGGSGGGGHISADLIFAAKPKAAAVDPAAGRWCECSFGMTFSCVLFCGAP
jgi:hypothetical protein